MISLKAIGLPEIRIINYQVKGIGYIRLMLSIHSIRKNGLNFLVFDGWQLFFE